MPTNEQKDAQALLDAATEAMANAKTEEEKAAAQQSIDEATVILNDANAAAEAAEREAAAKEEERRAAELAKKVKKLDIPEGCVALLGTNCACGGDSYVADKNGIVVVKAEHADLLCRDFDFKRV